MPSVAVGVELQSKSEGRVGLVLGIGMATCESRPERNVLFWTAAGSPVAGGAVTHADPSPIHHLGIVGTRRVPTYLPTYLPTLSIELEVPRPGLLLAISPTVRVRYSYPTIEYQPGSRKLSIRGPPSCKAAPARPTCSP